jgi:hypothetical protein
MKETFTALESLLNTVGRVLEKISKFKNSQSERFILQFMVMLFLLFVVVMGVYVFKVLPELIKVIALNSA